MKSPAFLGFSFTHSLSTCFFLHSRPHALTLSPPTHETPNYIDRLAIQITNLHSRLSHPTIKSLLSLHCRSHVQFQPASSRALDLTPCVSSPPTSQTPNSICRLAVQITNLHSRLSHRKQDPPSSRRTPTFSLIFRLHLNFSRRLPVITCYFNQPSIYNIGPYRTVTPLVASSGSSESAAQSRVNLADSTWKQPTPRLPSTRHYREMLSFIVSEDQVLIMLSDVRVTR